MLRVSCPSCGAPVEFRSHASVMAVCEFCRTTVVKDQGAVRDLGKLSSVLEDYSPIQLGTSGRIGARAFTVVGRIQLRYDAGLWNEWFLVFDDGGKGWLGDSSGRYVVTVEREPGPAWPAFEAIRVGHEHDIGVGTYIASEKRVARAIGGQGELPMVVGDGWEARVADFRRGADFVTLDYSDGPNPTMYLGAARTLGQMHCQLLRDDATIKEISGKYRGRVDSLLCPHCGTAIAYLPGVTPAIVCQSCQTPLDASTPTVEVLRTGEAASRRYLFTLPIGSTGKLGGRELRVLGAMRRVDDEGNAWSEYLLHNGQAGFSWLVETEDEWWRSEVIDEWPAAVGAVSVRLDRVAYTRLYDYTARVELALGAFNWRVAAGDTVRVSEYQHGPTRLAAELTPDEFTWSRSSRIAFDQVRAAFGLKRQDLPAPRASVAARSSKGAMAGRFLIWLFALNLIPLVFHFSGAVPWVFFGALALVLPTFFFDNE